MEGAAMFNDTDSFYLGNNNMTSTPFDQFVPVVSECTKKDTETFCSFFTEALVAHQKSNRIDFNNINESGWIWVSFAVYIPLCVFGIIGNILTIIMFSKYIKKTTTSVFIIALAVVDLLVCGISMPIWMFTTLNEFHGSEFLCKAEKLVYFIAIPMSAGILLIIAVDRFILIFCSKTNIVTRFRAKIIIFILGLACLAIAIPQTLSFTTLYKMDDELVASICQGSITCNTLKCRATTDYLSKEAWYYMWQSLIISFLVMAVAFTTIYCLIFAKVYKLHLKMVKWKNPSQEKKVASTEVHADHATFSSVESSFDSKSVANRDSTLVIKTRPKKRNLPHLHTARILFLVTFFFILAYAPLVFIMFLGSCEDKGKDTPENTCDKNDYRTFLWHFYFLHHVVNPIIYSFLNPRFRTALRKCVKSKFCRNSSTS